MAEKTAGKQRRRGRPFAKGTSGNPKGRPAEARNRATVIAQALLDNEAEALAAKAVEMALAGDGAALRLCLDRLVPPRREVPVSISIPTVKSIADAVTAMTAILDAAGRGQIALGEAAAFAGLIDVHRRAIETAELEHRIALLEKEVSTNERY